MRCFFVSKNNYSPREKSGISNFSAQHLLISKRVINELLDLARIRPTDTILDIGAGAGAITFPAAEKAGQVLAIESDPVLAGKIEKKMGKGTNIRVRQADILRTSLPKAPFSVVANIPYSITTPILGKLLDQPAVPLQRAVLIIEKGAAKRFTAAPITDPRILVWRMWHDIRLVRTVSPHHFAPPPHVDSAVVTICKKPAPAVPLKHHARFLALASHALRYPLLPFGAALSEIFTSPQLARLARTLRTDRTMPISHLQERQWGELFHAMLRHVEPCRWPRMPKKNARGLRNRRK